VLALPPCEGGNTVTLASAGAISVGYDALRANASKLRRDTGLNLLPTIARLIAARGGAAVSLYGTRTDSMMSSHA